MLDRLERLDADELDRRPSRPNDVDETEAGVAAYPWIDIDQAIAESCKTDRRPMPDDIEGAVARLWRLIALSPRAQRSRNFRNGVTTLMGRQDAPNVPSALPLGLTLSGAIIGQVTGG
jgi:hypothetical protein